MTEAARRNAALVAVCAALASCGGESAVDPEPVVAVDVPSLHFSAEAAGAVPSTQQITVVNGGGGTLAAPTASVSYVEGAGGWLAATVAGFQVTVAVTPEALARGHYAGLVTVTSTGSANGSVSIPVALEVTSPELGLSLASLSFASMVGVAPAPKTVTVSNAGDGALARPTATASTLLTATVAGDSAPFTITVSLRDPIVLEGNWTGSITVAAANAANGPITVPVTIAVLPVAGTPTPGTVACYRAADSMCQEYSSTCSLARTAFSDECTASGGTIGCPTEGKVGGCVVPYGTAADADRYVYWYYAPKFTVALGQGLCTASWSWATWTAP
jgi:hypothetical protein